MQHRTSFHIRPVCVTDVDTLVALWSIVFPEYNDPTYPQRDPLQNITRKLALADGLFWVAVSDAPSLDMSERFIGSVMGGYDGHRGWIYALGVHPAHRRQGAASALLLHAEHALHKLGCVKVNMQVSDGNAAALNFYAAHGYKTDAVISIGKRLGAT